MIKLIVARASNNVIGKDNDLVWDLPDDMKFFMSTTSGHIVIMGRKNWDSIPAKYRPLPNRLNIIVTRNKDYQQDSCEVYHSIEEAIAAHQEDERDIYIIGGGEIYKYAIEKNLLDEMLITEINQDFEGDTYFPDFDQSLWKKEILQEHPADERHQCSFTICRYYK